MQERLFNTHMWEHLIFDTLWYTAINKLIVQDRLYIEEPRPMRSDTIILKTAKSIIVIIRRTQRHSSQVDPHTNGWALILVLLKILDLHIHSTFSLWILFQTWSFATTNQDQDIDKSYNSTNTIKNITFSWVSDLRPYSRARDQSLLSRPMPKTRWCGSFRSHSPPLLLGFEGRTAQKEANLIVQIKISHIFSNTNENSLTSIECNLQSQAASLVWDAEASGIPMHPNSTEASALEYPRIRIIWLLTAANRSLLDNGIQSISQCDVWAWTCVNHPSSFVINVTSRLHSMHPAALPPAIHLQVHAFMEVWQVSMQGR